MKFLITDDNLSMRKLIRQSLWSSTDEVLECESGNVSIHYMTEFKPDVVLMDFHPEKYKQTPIVQQIRNIHPSATIIMISDYDTPAFREFAIREGASAFF